MLKIKELFILKTGYNPPKEFIGLGGVFYLQPRDYNDGGSMDEGVSPSIEVNPKTEKHFLEDGDVLVAARSWKNFAVVYKKEVEPAVAASSFIILRLKEVDRVIPEYAAWFINHPRQQAQLKFHSRGTAMPSINKQILGELEIAIPPLETQNTIVKLDQLKRKEKEIESQISELKEALFNQQLIKSCIN